MSARVDFYREWRDLMRSWGFTVLEAAGWETRDAEPRTAYDPGQLYVEHHDASTALSGNWGALAYILANKLANIVTARDGQIMLCAAGVEWHAGVGAYPGIPTNGANPRSMGNEVCNSGSEAYDPRCTAAIVAGEAAWCIVAARNPDRVIGHKEWAKPEGRKQDPRVDMNARRAQVTAAITNPLEDDMGQLEGRQAIVLEAINTNTDATRHYLGVLAAKLNEIAAQIDGVDLLDEAELAVQLAPLVRSQLTVLSGADLEAFADALAAEQDRRARDGDPATGPVS